MAAKPYTILITGGSSQISQSIARQLLSRSTAANPIRIAFTSRSADRAQSAVQSLGASSLHVYASGAVSSAGFWKAAAREPVWRSAEQQETSLGPVHVLVNAAGCVRRGPLARIGDAEIEEMVQANLMGAIWSSKYLLPNLLKGKRDIGSRETSGKMQIASPCIVNISSVLATHGGAGAAVYAATKGAMVSFTRALSEEYGRLGIRVNTILPGFIDTAMIDDGLARNDQATMQAAIPKGRFGTTEEVAKAVEFLVQNDYANGTILNLDGGLSGTSVVRGIQS